jgi:hypothetical protein
MQFINKMLRMVCMLRLFQLFILNVFVCVFYYPAGLFEQEMAAKKVLKVVIQICEQNIFSTFSDLKKIYL